MIHSASYLETPLPQYQQKDSYLINRIAFPGMNYLE